MRILIFSADYPKFLRDLYLGRVGDQKLRREVGEQRALGGRVGTGELEQQRDRDLEPNQRIGLPGRGGPNLLGRPAQGVLEEGDPDHLGRQRLTIASVNRVRYGHDPVQPATRVE